MIDELRELHLGIPRPDPGAPRPSDQLRAAYEAALSVADARPGRRHRGTRDTISLDPDPPDVGDTEPTSRDASRRHRSRVRRSTDAGGSIVP